jgi:energy-converting hydrogenase Eha subunit C
VAFALGNTRIEKITKYAFLANGWMMLISAIAYVLDITIILFFCMYLGMGAAVLTADIALSKLFKDLQSKN